MSKLFPIAKIEENQLANVKGEKSWFFKIDSIDLESLDEFEVKSFYDELLGYLLNLNSMYFYKFYRINQKNFLNTNDPCIKDFFITNLQKESDHLKIFFEGEDLFSDVDIFDDYINFNGNYKKILSVKEFGENLVLGDINCDYVLNLKKIDTRNGQKKLDLIRSSHQGSMFKSKRDFTSEGAFEQAERLIYDLTHRFDDLFEIEFYFIPKSFSVESVNRHTNSLIENLNLLGVKVFIEGNNPKRFKSSISEIFCTLIPGVIPDFKYRQLTTCGDHLRELIPLNESKLMNRGIKLWDQKQKTIFLNLFDQKFKNKNILVSGATGSGKSVLVNKLVYEYVKDHPVVILDKGGSFKKQCLFHNGVVLKSEINPMMFRDARFLKEFILSVTGIDEYTRLQKSKMHKMIVNFLKDNKLNFFELLTYLEQEFIGITYYFSEIEDFISEEPINTNFLYVDIENYPKEKLSPLILFVLEFFKSIDEKEKVLVFDEAWSFLKGHEDYVDSVFRQIRKSGGMAIAIAQGYEDFSKTNSELYNSITNNSHFKFFFSQSEIKDPDISLFDNQNILKLNYKKGQFSDCYFKTADNEYRKIIRISLTDLEYELFNTEFDKCDLFYKYFDEYRKFFKTNKDTIQSFVRMKYV